MKFDFYTDPGHGWLKVGFISIVKLDIVDKITDCSYRRGDNAYLEEDCDMVLFIKRWEDYTGKSWDWKLNAREHHTNKSSKIRNYERW